MSWFNYIREKNERLTNLRLLGSASLWLVIYNYNKPTKPAVFFLYSVTYLITGVILRACGFVVALTQKVRWFHDNRQVMATSSSNMDCGSCEDKTQTTTKEKDMSASGAHTGSMDTKDEDPGFVVDTMPYTSVCEGKAEVLFPSSHDVFYNPVQEFNRDLSVAVLRVFAAEYKERKIQQQQKAESKIKARLKTEEGNKDIQEHSKSSDTAYTSQDTCSIPSDATSMTQNVSSIPPATSSPSSNSSTSTSAPVKDSSVEDEKLTEKYPILPPGGRDEEGIRILEGLAASGLRSIRYAKEVGGVKEIVANDISTQALECMRRNINHNKIENIVKPSHNDASLVMYENRQPESRFHAIDLDPYGSPHIFLDGAVQSVVDGGILLITCTDMAVLCGNSPETCYGKYGALSCKGRACHEMALRIVLQCLESHANRYGRYIVPLLSLSADFYVRVVVRVHSSKLKCKESFTKVSWVYQCVGCETTSLLPLGRINVNGRSIKYQLSTSPPAVDSCTHCGHRYQMAGPIWSDPIHDRDFLRKLKSSLVEEDFVTYRRMYGTLTMLEEELEDVPLYYVVDKLASIAGINLCKMVHFRSALLNAGYRVSMSHACKASIKTDAPPGFVWDVVRAWEKQNPANKSRMPDDRPGKRILTQESQSEVSFELHPDSNPESRKQDLLRFQINPERYWGPKSRARTSLFHGDQEEKRVKKQGKKRRVQNGDTDTSKKVLTEKTISNVTHKSTEGMEA
ncbi:hypothetical protein Pcinc_019049 [Petrolisthes cinctipes]|uniref:tRNA (guanine(26)-N(2))-dimethyltransferase n=1 Tax=Petrolisthes cinctipes TaxID=88211 RepID=A0AAE1KI99_PETCI|nr:hypothetical protein Pcinc_019049 [Petrolisthes cinctipes]